MRETPPGSSKHQTISRISAPLIMENAFAYLGGVGFIFSDSRRVVVPRFFGSEYLILLRTAEGQIGQSHIKMTS